MVHHITWEMWEWEAHSSHVTVGDANDAGDDGYWECLPKHPYPHVPTNPQITSCNPQSRASHLNQQQHAAWHLISVYLPFLQSSWRQTTRVLLNIISEAIIKK